MAAPSSMYIVATTAAYKNSRQPTRNPSGQERTCELGVQEPARNPESPAPGAKAHPVYEAGLVLVHPFEDFSGSVARHGKTLALCLWADFLHASASGGRRS